jgi:NAD(P)-dependent dehydrogenase (short-subunit alcohol dehydrogenase family)
MNSLADKVAIITGGAQGIGFGICRALGDVGCHVIVGDIRADRAQAAANEIVRLGLKCEAVELDVTREDSVQNVIQSVRKTHGQIDVFVNSAGVPPMVAPVTRLSTTEWTRVLNVNLYGVFLCCREVAIVMAEQKHGKIVNIASLNSVSPAALSVAYNVAKAGVVSLTQTLAVELAPFGVNVNAVSPGPIETEFHDTVMPQRAATLGITRQEMVERIRTAIPLGRWGQPIDIARAVLFLASDQSEWITGHNLIVSGGLSGVSASPPKEVILGNSQLSAVDH